MVTELGSNDRTLLPGAIAAIEAKLSDGGDEGGTAAPPAAMSSMAGPAGMEQAASDEEAGVEEEVDATQVTFGRKGPQSKKNKVDQQPATFTSAVSASASTPDVPTGTSKKAKGKQRAGPDTGETMSRNTEHKGPSKKKAKTDSTKLSAGGPATMGMTESAQDEPTGILDGGETTQRASNPKGPQKKRKRGKATRTAFTPASSPDPDLDAPTIPNTAAPLPAELPSWALQGQARITQTHREEMQRSYYSPAPNDENK